MPVARRHEFGSMTSSCSCRSAKGLADGRYTDQAVSASHTARLSGVSRSQRSAERAALESGSRSL